MFRRFRSSPAPAAPPEAGSPDQAIRDAFWIILGRGPAAEELRQKRVDFARGGSPAVAAELLASPEFHLIFCWWTDDVGIGKDPAAHESGLRDLGPDAGFLARAYELILGRAADGDGLSHYGRALAAGEARREVLRVLVSSEEFAERYKSFSATKGGYLPRDVQLCELANPAKWDNPDWLRLLRDLKALPHHKLAMHRKSYEFTQLLFGLTRLDRLRDTTSVLSVGAGHECVLYWLANHAGRVVATDMYEGRWQAEGAREGDDRVVEDPAQYAPFPYRTDRVSFMRMDGRALTFPDGEFDVVYSLSSIEHFGGLAGASAAMREMARVLKPGGVLVVATEYILSGPPHEETFTRDDVQALVAASGLSLVEPIDFDVYERYDYAADRPQSRSAPSAAHGRAD